MSVSVYHRFRNFVFRQLNQSVTQRGTWGAVGNFESSEANKVRLDELNQKLKDKWKIEQELNVKLSLARSEQEKEFLQYHHKIWKLNDYEDDVKALEELDRLRILKDLAEVKLNIQYCGENFYNAEKIRVYRKLGMEEK